jgi:putative MATE family efflux protein
VNAVARRRPVADAFELVLLALRGQAVDVASGPLRRAVILLAVPMVLEMAMESVFAVVDIFFVSRLGPGAVAAVGLTESLLTVVYTVAVGLSIGVTAVVARRIGEGRRGAAADAAFQGIVVGVVVSAILAVLGVVHAERLLGLMGADDAVVAMGGGYARIMFGGNATVLLLFLLNAAFRGAGDAAIAMRVLWIANGLNILLDPLLIFGIGPFPAMGVTGAAVASTVSRGVGVGLQLVILVRGAGVLRVGVANLRVVPAVVLRLLRLSSTGMLQVFISTASWIGLVRIISGFGSEAMAGYTIAIRIVLFALLPAWGLANAAATLVGQGLGAGRPDRAERAVWFAGRLNFYFLGTVALIFMAFAPWIAGLLGGDAATAAHAARGLRILSAGFVFYAYGMVLTQSFNGAGDAWTPTLLNLLCFWCLELPLAWFLAHRAGLGPDGAYLAVTVAYSTIALASALIFRRGRWKSRVV